MSLAVRDIGALLFGKNPERCSLVLVRAAFDASMDSPSGNTVVAGYSGTIGEWESVEDRWNRQLLIDRWPSLRMADLTARFGLDGALKRATPYVEILGNSQLRAAYALLRDVDWSSSIRDAEYTKVYPHRQHACLDLLLGVFAEDVRLGYDEEPSVMVAFDNDYGNSEIAARVYEAWRSRTGHPGFTGVTYAKGNSEWDGVPLQCGDLLAWLTRRSAIWKSHLEKGFEFQSPDFYDELTLLAIRTTARGRGVMWSDAIAKAVQETLKKMKASEAE
jgi:hypothetical protein